MVHRSYSNYCSPRPVSIRRSGHIVQDRPLRSVRWAEIPELYPYVGCYSAVWLQSWLQSPLYRSGLGVEPDGYARCPGQPGGIGAAGAATLDERGAAVCA
jgi:hypothetical protein